MKLPEFRTAYLQARRDAVHQAVARLQQATGAASVTLLKLVTDPRVPHLLPSADAWSCFRPQTGPTTAPLEGWSGISSTSATRTPGTWQDRWPAHNTPLWKKSPVRGDYHQLRIVEIGRQVRTVIEYDAVMVEAIVKPLRRKFARSGLLAIRICIRPTASQATRTCSVS
jgi:hypothetical protein